MGVHVTKKKTFYKTINTKYSSDKSLSFKSKGILGYLLSKSDGWKGQLYDIEKSSDKDGIAVVKSAMKELSNAGYAKLRNHPMKNGKMMGTYYQISDMKGFFLNEA